MTAELDVALLVSLPRAALPYLLILLLELKFLLDDVQLLFLLHLLVELIYVYFAFNYVFHLENHDCG